MWNLTHEERQKRRKKIAADVKAGMTLTAACRTHKCSATYVRNACEENGVVLPTKPRRANQTFRILADLLAGEMTQTEIARKYQVSNSHVSMVLKAATKAGVDKKEPTDESDD